jgi:hypothetical protein
MYNYSSVAFLQGVVLRIGTYQDSSPQGIHRVVQNCSDPEPAATHTGKAVSFSYHVKTKLTK